MADPITNKVQLTGYAGVQAGAVRFAGNKNYADLGARLGGQLTYNGLTASAEIGAGTTLNAKLSADLNVPISQKMGLNIGGSVRADYATSTRSVKSSLTSGGAVAVNNSMSGQISVNGDVTEFSNQLITQQDLPVQTSVKNTKYNDKNLTSELHAGVTFGSKNGSVTIGGMLANRTSLNSNITHNHIHEQNLTLGVNNNVNFCIENIPDGQQNSVAQQLLSQGAQNITIDGNTILGNIEQNKTIDYQKTDVFNKTFSKPSDELVAGVFAKGDYNINKSGSLQAFGNASVLGGQFEGNAGIRFNF